MERIYNKKILVIIVVAVICSILFVNRSTVYASFADLEYPPDSSGKVDYTDKDANKKPNNKETEENNYIGKSSNNNLKSITIENSKIMPDFNPNIVNYEVNLDSKDISEINIMAEAEDKNAKVEGQGTITIKEGANDAKIIVTAENGSVKIYNLTINTPKEQSHLELENLEIYGVDIETGIEKIIKLDSVFEQQKYEYNAIVNSNISSLNVKAKPNKECLVEINGEKDIQVGENKVIIKLIDKKDKDINTIYEINIKRETKEETIEENKNKEKQNMIVSVLIITIAIICILFVFRKKKSKRGRREK